MVISLHLSLAEHPSKEGAVRIVGSPIRTVSRASTQKDASRSRTSDNCGTVLLL